MKYYITELHGNDRKILSEHDNLDDALCAGEKYFKELKCTISCIGANKEDGKLPNKYKLYKTWF